MLNYFEANNLLGQGLVRWACVVLFADDIGVCIVFVLFLQLAHIHNSYAGSERTDKTEYRKG